MAQKWEYKVVLRWRDIIQTSLQAYQIQEWIYYEDGKEIGKIDMLAKLKELGEAGWELVSILPQASNIGTQYNAYAFTGATTEATWVFKRPKM
jgi:hypothetical protein